jgi:hypothetical protein
MATAYGERTDHAPPESSNTPPKGTTRIAVETPDAKIIVERPNGKRQELVFL